MAEKKTTPDETPDETPNETPDETPDAPPPGRAATEIDRAGLQANKRANTEKVGRERTPRYWEREDAPPGSTSKSLAVIEGGRRVRVHGPTHYHHLADGRVLAGYTGGTHHTEPGEDGEPDKVTRILAIHEG